MIMDEEQKLLETLINVFDDLQSFLIHKNHQHIIFAFLQLKKLLRKGSLSSKMSTDRKFVEPASQAKSSKIKRCISGDQGKSIGKQSNGSFDIIKGAEFFNQSRKSKPHYQKQYSEVTRSQRPYMDRQRQEPTTFTGPYKTSSKKVQHPKSNPGQVVPRIAGLVSQEEISDIERRSRRSFQYRETQRSNALGADYRIIMEVEDDDDEFEDVVLNRLDMIEEKVNQMLKNKHKLKIQRGNANIPTQHPRPDHYPQTTPQTRSRLQTVYSGPNIIHHQPLRVQRASQSYQYKQPLYRHPPQQMAPRNNMLYTFKNTNNNPYTVQNTRISSGSKGQFTERARKLSEKILSQLPVYVNGNQQYAEGYRQQPYRPTAGYVRESQPQAYQEQNIMRNNPRPTARHFMDSTGTLRYSIEESQRQRPSYSRDQQIHEKQAYTPRSRQEVFIDGNHVYKYIPMVKYVPDKTQRHYITRRVGRGGQAETCDEGQYRVGKVVFIDKVGGEVVRRGRDGDDFSSPAPELKDNLYNKSGKTISVIQRPLVNSKIKAYTDQGDRPDEFSVTSDGGIRSEIRQVREVMKHYVSNQADKRESNKTRNTKREMIQKDVPTNDYRYRQETQKKHLILSRKSEHQAGVNHKEEVIVSRAPKQEKVISVVRQTRQSHQYVQKRLSSRNSDTQVQGKQQRYQEFSPSQDEAIYRSRTSNSQSIKSQPSNFQREDAHVYERTQSSQVAQRRQRENQFRTIIRKDDNYQSQKKVSADSLHTFQSIPFNRLQQRKNTLEQMLENNCEKISEQQSYYQEEEEEDQEEI